MLCLPPIIVIVLVLILFLVANKWEWELPIIDRKLSLSLGVGLASLLVGLSHVEHRSGGGGIAITFESATSVRGWPLAWWGYQSSFSALWATIAVLADMLLVTVITLICFSLVHIFTRQAPRWVFKYASLSLALVWILFPVWGARLIESYTISKQEESSREYMAWIERNAESVIGSIQIDQCSRFTLVPSREYPGSMNIQVSATARVNKPNKNKIRANIIPDATDSGLIEEYLEQQLSVGEHTLNFTLRPIEVASNQVNIHRPGPYNILLMVESISVPNSGGGGSFSLGEINYARGYLGIAGDNLRLVCQSPPYTLADLGLPLEPTSQP